MNSFDDNLQRAVRELAAAFPQGPSPELQQRLENAFTRHHIQRKRRRLAVVTGALVAVSLAFAWLQAEKKSWKSMAARQSPAAVQGRASEVPKESTRSIARVVAPHKSSRFTRKRAATIHTPQTAEPPILLASNDFIALPAFDPAVPLGPSRILRVELPGSALQLVGYPVNQQLLERRVLTDVLVGQDGTPYAVRLVQTRSTQ